MGGGGAPAQDFTAQNKQAALSREMYSYAKRKFGPLENKLIAEMNNPNLVNRTVNKSKRTMGLSLNASDAAQQREAARYGITMTPQRQQSNARKNDLNRALSTTSAANTARRGVDEYKTGVLNSVASLGRQTAGDAAQGFGLAANLEANRNNTNRQVAAQNEQATMSAIGTGVGIAASMII